MTWQELCESRPRPFDKLVILGQGFIILGMQIAFGQEKITFKIIEERDYEAYAKHCRYVEVNGQHVTMAEVEGIEYPEVRRWELKSGSRAQMALLKETTLVRAEKWMKDRERIMTT